MQLDITRNIFGDALRGFSPHSLELIPLVVFNSTASHIVMVTKMKVLTGVERQQNGYHSVAKLAVQAFDRPRCFHVDLQLYFGSTARGIVYRLMHPMFKI